MGIVAARLKKRIRPLFAQERAALNAGLFVDGLLGDERRKTGWMRAEAAGDPGPWRQQPVLGCDRWMPMRCATWCATMPPSTCRGTAMPSSIGRSICRRARLKATYVPGDVSFSTKPQLAAEMIERALAAGVPFRWVAADSVYGVGDIERDLLQAGNGYVMGGTSNLVCILGQAATVCRYRRQDLANTQRRSDWRRLSAGAGTKGPRGTVGNFIYKVVVVKSKEHHMAIEKDLLDQLLAGRDPKDVFNKDGLVDQLKKAL